MNTGSPTGYSAVEKMSDADLDYLIGEYEKSNAQTAMLSDEELVDLLRTYEGPDGGAGDVAPKVDAPPPELSTGEAIAGGLRELAGGAAFEFADEAEAATRAALSGKSYDEVVNEIRLERAKFNEAYPVLGPTLNIAGGIGTMFVPGVNVAGRAIQAGTGISKLASPVARAAATGAVAGGTAGFGSGEGFTDSAKKAAIGAAFGAPLGVAAHGAGEAIKWGRGVIGARGADAGDEEAARKAAEIISRRIAEGGLDNAKIAELAELAKTYGIDNAPLGSLTPELSRLTENVVNTPSGEQADLARRLFNVQSSAPQRVKSLAKDAVPTPDYFASEEKVLETLRTNAERNYGSGWQNVEIRDPRIMQVLDDPAIRSAYMDALGNSRLQQQEAILNGVDPSQFKLREIFDPILDAEGAVVGLSPTGKMAPDMGTLNQVKIALDRKISSLYASGQGGQATSLRGLRDAFVKRLDEVGPKEFKAARQQYKGDIEIKEALEQGKNSAGLRWQQFGKFMKDYSPGEQQAFKTGFMQQVMKGFEDTGTRQNFAKNLLKENSLKKFQAVMDPGEFQVFEAALRREEQLFNDIGQATGNSATFRRAAEREDIQNQIAGGNIENAVDLFVNPTPGNIALRTARLLSNMRNANVSRATYTQLARMLKASTPEELDEVLMRLEEAAPVQQAADRALERRVTKGGVAAASTLAPPPEDTRGQLSDDFEVVVPSLTEEDLSGLSTMPTEGAPADAMPGPQSSEGTLQGARPPANLDEASQNLIGMLGSGIRAWVNGDVETPEGVKLPAARVAEMLRLPLDAWRAMSASSDLSGIEEVVGFNKGGSVQAFNKGGNKGEKKRGYDYGNAARTFGQGLTFGTADEIEAFLRSNAGGRDYKTERDEIRRLQERYALANPNTALALEGAGMIGGSMLVPSLGATRALASAPRLARIGAAFGDDLAQGIAYTAGKAKERGDIANDIRKDARGNAAAFGVATGVEQGGRAAGRRVAGKIASTDRGYQAALALKRLMSKY